MAESVNYQCPNCMGPLRFDAAKQMLVCDHCDSTFTPDQVKAYYEAKQQAADAKAQQAAKKEEAGRLSDYEKMATAGGASANVTEASVEEAAEQSKQAQTPIDAYLQRASWNDQERAGMRTYTCSSCGAQLTVDVTTAIEECPYCGNQAMAPGTFASGAKPDLIIPFKLDKNAAEQALTNYYKGKKFLPKEFAEANRIAHVQGVYVPFWLYDGTAEGSGTFEGRNLTVWREGEFEVTKTDVYRIYRAGTSSFTRIPADGSAKMPDGHMDAIEPFDYTELREFSTAYLPGFSAERYDQDAEECSGRASKRMTNTLGDQLKSSVCGYQQVNTTNISATAKIEKTQQALFPVWMLHTRWENDDYLFAMNGQSGRLVGDLPVSKPKVAAWFLGILVVVAALCVALDVFALHLRDTTSQIILYTLPALAIAIFTCWFFYSQMKTAKEQDSAFRYVDNGGFDLTASHDQFVNSFITRRRVQTNPPPDRRP